MTAIRRCIRVVLSGLQQSNQIDFHKRKETEALIEYMKIIHGVRITPPTNAYIARIS
jgi:hypothetical protein